MSSAYRERSFPAGLRAISLLLAATCLANACTPSPPSAELERPDKGIDSAASNPAIAPSPKLASLDQWRPPSDSEIPNDSLGAAIRRGLALLTHTRDSLPAYAASNLNCTSCHLDAGRKPNAAPLTGVHARFPKYMDRTGAVIPVADRVNYCFTRSLAGSALPVSSREMQDILSYLAFISRGVPVGANLKGEGMPKMPALVGDIERGRNVFATTCSSCHGGDGQGIGPVPALWGPSSYSIGASMAREERAASFIRHNMPLGSPGSLTDQQAFDVAAYVNSRPRPDSPGKQNDWPLGGAPRDVPYDTKGHSAYKPPPVLPRNPKGAIVPAPAPAAGRTTRS